MYKRCTTERAAQQQRRIEECLLNEMHKRDYRDITVSSLCEQAELSRKTFYRLFGSKDDVLQALIDHTLMDYAKFRLTPEQIHPGAPAELQRFFCYWIANESLLDALTGNGKMRSRTMLLNGRELVLGENDKLPCLCGEAVSAGTLEVAPGGCTFIVL